MARRSPQTLGKRERERAKLEKRERKQQKKAAAAAARSGQPTAPATDPQSDEPTLSETG
jgi:hypothetical protein